MSDTVTRRCKCGCGKSFVTTANGRKRYYDARCRKRHYMRKKRREGRDDSEMRSHAKPVDQGFTYTSRDESKDGRATARGGRGYNYFATTPWPERLAREEIRQVDALKVMAMEWPEDQPEPSQANVSRWMAKWNENQAFGRAREGWEQAEDVKTAMLDYEAFTRRFHPDAEIPGYHLEWEKEIDGVVGTGGRLGLLAPQRHGKLLADSTPVLTPDGWRTHGDLRVGDHVYAPDGTATRVVAVKPKATASVEVEFSDGSVIKCHPEHLWTVYDRRLRRHVTRETQHLADRVTRDGRRNLQVDWTDPLQAPDAELPIDPYFLGVWLGDGKADGVSICGEPDDLSHIELELKRRGVEASWRTTHAVTGVDYLGFKGHRHAWRSLNLLDNKHIPDVYFTASERQRRDLLAGLVDTDGSVESDKGRVRFVTCDNRLRDDVIRLAATLGYRAGVHTVPPTTSTSGIVGRQDVHYVQWTPHDGLPQGLALDRKCVSRAGHIRHDRRSIVDIRPTDSPEPGHCIAVDHPSQLYLAGDRLVPTHNTEFLIRYCQRRIAADPNICILWVSRAKEVAEESVGLLRQYLEQEDFCEAVLGPGETFRPDTRSGRSWTDEKFTVKQRDKPRKSPTIRALGIGGTTSGRDADIIIIDDPQEREDCESPTTNEKQFRYFVTTLAARKMSYTGMALITSRRHMNDIPGKLMREHGRDWRFLIYQAHDPTCTISEAREDEHVDCLLWPNAPHIDFAFLMGQKRADPAFFECNYMNNPKADGTVSITAEDIDVTKDHERRVGDIPRGVMRLVAGIDPADAKPVAAVLWGFEPPSDRFDKGRRHVIDVMEAGLGVEGAREILKEWKQRYSCSLFVVEKNIAQSWWQDADIREITKGEVQLKPHYTDRINKWSTSTGVVAMFARMRTKGSEPNPPPDTEITLPWGDEASRLKIDKLVRSFLAFDPNHPEAKHNYDDLCMAAWFPQPTMDSWVGATTSYAEVEYRRTPYVPQRVSYPSRTALKVVA